MKNSYYKTPRKLEDCTFVSSAEAFHSDPNSNRFDIDDLVLAVSVIGFIVITVLAWLKII